MIAHNPYLFFLIYKNSDLILKFKMNSDSRDSYNQNRSILRKGKGNKNGGGQPQNLEKRQLINLRHKLNIFVK